MIDIERSIIGNPRSWSKPEEVAERERRMRDGIAEFRKQEQQDRARTQELSKAILTPQPAERPRGFAEDYPICVGRIAVWDAETQRYVLRESGNFNGNFMWGDAGGRDDDGSGA